MCIDSDDDEPVVTGWGDSGGSKLKGSGYYEQILPARSSAWLKK